MILTKRSDYGLRVVLTLAACFGQRAVCAEQIAEEGGLPGPFVKKLIQQLARAHVTRAVRGRGGGYTLSRNPSEISLFQVLNAFEDLAPVTCLRRPGKPTLPDSPLCALEVSAPCATRPAWALVDRRIKRLLDSISLAELLQAVHEQGFLGASAKEGAV